jgi:hypothetical protein
MPTFRIDYTEPRRPLPGDDEDDSWDRAPEQVTSDGYTIDTPWLTFWAGESREAHWAPPPVLRVRAEDVGRIEWLDRPEPDADSIHIRISYKLMKLFTDDGDMRRRDELLVGTYSVGDNFISCGWSVLRTGLVDPEDIRKPPILTVRTELVERIERVEPSIHPIPRKPSST